MIYTPWPTMFTFDDGLFSLPNIFQIAVAVAVFLQPPVAHVKILNMEKKRRLTGTVAWFNDAKGYGYVLCEHETVVFVHYTAIKCEGSQRRSLVAEQPVEIILDCTTPSDGIYRAEVVISSGNSHEKR